MEATGQLFRVGVGGVRGSKPLFSTRPYMQAFPWPEPAQGHRGGRPFGEGRKPQRVGGGVRGGPGAREIAFAAPRPNMLPSSTGGAVGPKFVCFWWVLRCCPQTEKHFRCSKFGYVRRVQSPRNNRPYLGGNTHNVCELLCKFSVVCPGSLVLVCQDHTSATPPFLDAF